MPVVHIRTIERDNHADVEEQRLSRSFDAQHVKDLDYVIALDAPEIHFRDLHDLFHVYAVGVQDPLLGALELARRLHVLGNRLLAHENLLNAEDTLKGHFLENVRLNAPEELEIFVIFVVGRVEWPRLHLLKLGLLFEQAYPQHQFFGIVVRENAIQVALEVLYDPFADLANRELLVGHDLVAELDAQKPRTTTSRILVIIGQLVIFAHPLSIIQDPCVDWIGVPENLGKRGDLFQRCVLQRALHVLGALLALAEIAVEVNTERRRLHRFRDIDELLQPRYAERYVFSADAGEMESVQGHLCCWLADALRSHDADHLARVDA
mmetsp:Transcript_95530/g.270215  ORF Transcript_95530/g.270215 Transcript_95530/m.270215 type:complete len:322 (-) Transcript_95530:3304-4269(-)